MHGLTSPHGTHWGGGGGGGDGLKQMLARWGESHGGWWRG